MDEARFWQMIEHAWQAVGGHQPARQKLAEGKLSEDQAMELADSLDEVLTALSSQLKQFNQAELLEFDRILERKLYDIDRAEIQEHTDGSDDGFLYARGFIVALGKQYYDAVNARPSLALPDLDCEEMCFLSSYLYEEKFGTLPDTGISRESCSNKEGWPDLQK